MKNNRLIIAYCILLTIQTICDGEQEEKNNQSPTPIALEQKNTTLNTQGATAVELNDPKQELAKKDDALTTWHNHLASLLIKGDHWDANANIPTQDWIDNAENYAKAAITQNISSKEEIETSFSSTINDKFITIEKGTNIIAVATIINDFKQKIDTFVEELSAQQQKEEEEKKKAKEQEEEKKKKEAKEQEEEEKKKKEIKESEKEPIAQEPLEVKTEDTAQQTDLTESAIKNKKTKKEKKLKQEWQDVLESIKSEGLDQEEAKNILDDATTVIPKLIEQLSSETDTFKNEFLNAIEARKSKALVQFDDQSIQRITNLFQKTALSVDQSVDLEQQNSMNQINQSNIAQKENVTRRITPIIKKTDEAVTKQEAPQVPQEKNVLAQPAQSNQNIQKIQTELAQKAVSERQAQAKNEMLNASLARKIQIMAQKKAAEEKAAEQKGILSSLAEKVFGSWWTGTTTEQQGTKELVAQSNKEIDDAIDPSIPTETRAIIKHAYEVFQKTLFDFNSKEYWDEKEGIPNVVWFDRMAKFSCILIKHQIIGVNNIINALDETIVAINKDMTVNNHKKIAALLLKALDIETKKQRNFELEEAKKRRKIEKAKQEEQERIAREERERLEEIKRQEQEKKALIDQQEKEIQDAFNNFKNVHVQWQTLRDTIKSTPSATAEQNDIWTNEALKITESLLKNNNITREYDPKNIIAGQIADFSKSLLDQQKPNEIHMNVQPYIERFNKTVHTYTEKP